MCILKVDTKRWLLPSPLMSLEEQLNGTAKNSQSFPG